MREEEKLGLTTMCISTADFSTYTFVLNHSMIREPQAKLNRKKEEHK